MTTKSDSWRIAILIVDLERKVAEIWPIKRKWVLVQGDNHRCRIDDFFPFILMLAHFRQEIWAELGCEPFPLFFVEETVS